MKKKLIFLSIAASFVVMATSCKKEDTPAPTVEGFWVGKYGFNADNPTEFYAVVFKNNGTMKVYSDGVDTANAGNKSDGTYVIANGILTTSYNGLATKASVNGNFNYMLGTFGTAPDVNGNGTFVLNKQ